MTLPLRREEITNHQVKRRSAGFYSKLDAENYIDAAHMQLSDSAPKVSANFNPALKRQPLDC
jgi:hypothetical protein